LRCELTPMVLALCVAVYLGLGEPTAAQESVPGAKAPAAPAPLVSEQRMPTDAEIVALICSTLIALNQANTTGNYSVLREIGAPGFQVVNSTGQLSQVFADLRNRNFDLSPIVLLQPKLIRAPEINSDGMLRVAGFFSTQPERLNFDLIFQSVNDRWRLFGIAANTTVIRSADTDAKPTNDAATGAPGANAVKESERPDGKGTAGATSKPAVQVAKEKVGELEATADDKSQSDERSAYNPLRWFR
jgi:hypothetical protein